MKIDCIDALTWLKSLPDEYGQTCVTSPPYYNLRDYGEEGQLGLEATPEEYLVKMVAIFHELKRVMRSDGTLWLNMGDSYASGGGYFDNGCNDHMGDGGTRKPATWRREEKKRKLKTGLPAKNLMGMPWRLALALQQDGWILRSDIIWHKPSAMPESCRDRPTKSHEYLFLLAKSPKYYYDGDAIREPHAEGSLARKQRGVSSNHKYSGVQGGLNAARPNVTHESDTPHTSAGSLTSKPTWVVAERYYDPLGAIDAPSGLSLVSPSRAHILLLSPPSSWSPVSWLAQDQAIWF